MLHVTRSLALTKLVSIVCLGTLATLTMGASQKGCSLLKTKSTAASDCAQSSGAFKGVSDCQGDAPSLGAVTPVAGRVTGGTTLTLAGTGFLKGVAVTLGGQACTSEP